MAKTKSIISVVPEASHLYSNDDLMNIFQYPHILGHLAGYDRLSLLHSDWIHYLFLKDGEKVRSLMCHRGSFKSTTLAVGVVWRWLFFPEDTIMLLRKDFSAAVQAIGEVHAIMQKPEIVELFKFAHGEYPMCKKEQVGSAIIDYSFRKKPSMSVSLRGVGSGTNVTGLHYNIVLVDDLSNLKSRISRAERLSDVSIYREITANVQNRGDKDTGFTRVIGTPWADPARGECLEAIIPTPKYYYLEDTNLITPSELEEIRRSTTTQLFNCNYLMKFTSADNAVFKDPIFGEWKMDKIEVPRAHVDFAYSKEGDHTAMTIGTRRADGTIQMIGFLWPGNGIEHIPRIKEIMKLYGARKIYVENNSDKGWAAKTCRELGMNVGEYTEKMNKNVKIATYGLEVWHKIVWAFDTDPAYINQILDFQDVPGNNSDDAPDSYASLVRACFSKKSSNTARWDF